MAVTAWSRLTAKGKARLKASGVLPASYNAYARKSKKERAKLDRAQYVRGQTKAQQAQRSRRTAIKDKKQKVIDHMMTITRGRASRKKVEKGVKMMTPAELDETLDMDYAGLVAAAQQPPDDRGYNPRWYSPG